MNRLKDSLIDYRKFRFSKLNTPEFSHLWLLLFWPVYGILFFLVERVLTERNWHLMYCPADDWIPFREEFLIPYLWWFVFLCGMLLFTLLFDADAFRKMMWFIILTYSVTILIYLIYPTAQELRPTSFERDNFLTRYMASFYQFDTNTNVCPSIHVIGSVAVLVTSWHTRWFRTRAWQCYFWIATILISLSTVFLKQHSLLDLPPAILLCALAYPLAFHGDKIFRRRKRAAVVGAEENASLPEGETAEASGEKMEELLKRP